MKILCGYTDTYNPVARKSLTLHAPEIELVNLNGDNYAYWRAIEERWTGKEDLVLIEQDNVITQDVIPSFLSCSHDWCSYSYQCIINSPNGSKHVGELTTGLGCTKFSAQLQKRYPLQQAVNVLWTFADMMILECLIAPPFNGRHSCVCHEQEPASNAPHVHGSIEHLHDYPLLLR